MLPVLLLLSPHPIQLTPEDTSQLDKMNTLSSSSAQSPSAVTLHPQNSPGQWTATIAGLPHAQ